MLLQPRNFKFKRKQKKRVFRNFQLNFNKLNYGNMGLLILNSLFLTANQLFRFKLFLKRSSRKGDYTRRQFWFFVFPHLPLTRKANGVRMGKGKGKLECWFTTVRAGTLLLQFKNLRHGRATFFFKQLTHKLGIPTKAFFLNKYYLTFPFKKSKKIFFKNFW
jgi:large subunit ribosomal protein L16